ncbi:acyltransferase family protein [Pseudomonas arsenicoxydans]|uniref:Acyltransferase n=1 Tax=Pseudomonas arsenicoxydans TaxID=702115 RepID=A0A502HVG3_9PSED|nr:acyltransferase [Pseudomonas arsenicoxydans]TPG78819.1 acyltransferase [Pseudomonas arsenicoxydans]
MSAKLEHGSNRLFPLEAYRGIAAFIVLVHHFFLGFSPYTTGLLVRNQDSLVGQPFFALFNGTAAVGFFFTLSGFVLCWSYFNHESPQKLLLAFLKRFPRLAAIVTISTVASYCLFKLNFYYFHEASKLSLSPWLATFANGWKPEFEPSFWEALWQGMTTFFTGEVNYNTNLWTMKFEFFGSLIVFMLACFISAILEYRYLIYAFLVISISALFYNTFMLPFVAGTFLSVYLAKNKHEIPLHTSIALIIFGLYMLGYMIPEKSYAWASAIPDIMKVHTQTLLHTLGSACIIFATMSNQKVFKTLNGKFLRGIGKISFPLYLIHTLVICSLSSYVYVKLAAYGMSNTKSLIIVFIVTATTSIALAIPLSRFDDWWVKQVNAITRKLLKDKQLVQ